MSGVLVLLADIAENLTLTRYVSVAGLSILLFDWLLTLPDEIALVWPARRSLLKFLFLLDKYLTMATLIGVNLEMSGLSGIHFSNMFCQVWVAVHVVIGFFSLEVSTLLVMLRVNALWENKRYIRITLFCTFGLAFSTAFSIMCYGITRLFPHMSYNPSFKSCVFSLDAQVSFFASVYGIPLLYNFMLVALTAWNAFSKPRIADSRLPLILGHDGLFYFIGVSSLHFSNMMIVAVAPTTLVFVAGYFAWALVVTLMNRFIIGLQQMALGVPREGLDWDNSEQNAEPQSPCSDSSSSNDIKMSPISGKKKDILEIEQGAK